MDHLWAPWRLSYVTTPKEKPPTAGPDCFICRGLAAGDDRANLIVARTASSVVYLNRFPYNNGHLLVCPQAHKARLDELVKTSQLYTTLVRGGQWDVNSLFNLLQVWRDIPLAAADVYGQTEELVHWYEEWVSMVKGKEKILQERYRAGNVRLQDVEQTRAERFYAELTRWLVAYGWA